MEVSLAMKALSSIFSGRILFMRMLECFVMLVTILSVVGCGNDLSRSKAKDMIENGIRPLLGVRCSVDSKSCSALNRFADKEGLSRLEGLGFIRMKESSFSLLGTQNHFVLTDSAAPYIYRVKDPPNGQELAIIAATVSSVEVTGISKPADMFGRKICTATYSVTYKPTPFGEILEKWNNTLSASGDAMFVLYDDGWRMDSLGVGQPRVSAEDAQKQKAKETLAGSQASETSAPSSAGTTSEEPIAAKFCGIWEYDESGSKGYLKVSKQQNGKFRFLTGYKYKGKITWTEPMIKNTDGIYLQLRNGKLEGEFVSSNFYATHGDEFTYRVTLDLAGNNRLMYAVWSSIRGDTDKWDATKISD